MTPNLFQVDAFTDEAFAGNPAGVCLLTQPMPDSWLQAVAREMNLSETAFLLPRGGNFNLRWFTPRVEVPLCGHATLASAHILWQQKILDLQETAFFETLSGTLTAKHSTDDWIRLDFPAHQVTVAQPPPGLLEALRVGDIQFVGRFQESFLVELATESDVRAATPNFAALENTGVRSVVLTSRSAGTEFDFVSRYFAPAMGVPEDPVTGSAHCALAPYWGAKLGKTEMNAYQASARGGVLRVRPLGERVEILGKAVTVFEAALRI